MGARYMRYRESGVTRGEFQGRPRLARHDPRPLDLGFIGNCAERINVLDLGSLDAAQCATLAAELQKMRLAVRRKIKLIAQRGTL